MTDIPALMEAYGIYRDSRLRFLEALGCKSNRDPLAEFSELLVAALTGDRRADSRVQKGWDLIAADDTKTQVRYLANPVDRWVNEHVVSFTTELDRYALVVFEGFEPTAVLVFVRDTLEAVGATLGKRHPNQSTQLQFTHANFRQLLGSRPIFAKLGIQILSPVVPPTVAP